MAASGGNTNTAGKRAVIAVSLAGSLVIAMKRCDWVARKARSAAGESRLPSTLIISTCNFVTSTRVDMLVRCSSCMVVGQMSGQLVKPKNTSTVLPRSDENLTARPA